MVKLSFLMIFLLKIVAIYLVVSGWFTFLLLFAIRLYFFFCTFAPMKRRKAFLYTLLLSSALWMVTSCTSSHSHQEGEHEHAEEAEGHEHEHEDGVIHFSEKQAKAAGLTLETVTAADFAEAIRVSGQVTVAQGDEAAVVAKSAGIVNFLRDHLSEGSAVKAGETFARISAEGVAGGDQMAQGSITLKHAKEAYERAKRLYADTIISRKEMLMAQQDYEQARQAMAGRQSGSGTSITAPMSGFVKNIMVKQGEYVELGQVIATITKNCNLQLRAEVPEKHFANMYKVRSANFEMSYGGGVQSLDALHGHLVSMGKTASEGSAYIPLTFEFENKGSIVPGAFADIWLLFNTRKNVISLPSEAITEEQGVYYVYVQLDEEDEFEKREVAIGMSNGLRTEITSGIKVGEKVVTKGVYQVKLAGGGAAPEAHSHQH